MNVHLILASLCLFFLACHSPADSSTATEEKSNLPEKVDPERDFPALFEAVQLGVVFPDSKTFADCTPLQPVAEIAAAFRAQRNDADFNLETFVRKHFELPIKYSSGFESDLSRSMSEHINALWPVLTREGSSKTFGTLLPLPNDYIVPGGRFGEIYYWDSYFTMLGLIESGKTEMVENMLDNFAHMINTVGHIPNGNRTYFLHRSQPPFFAAMVSLLAAQKGSGVLKKYQKELLAEYNFWMDGAEELSAENSNHRRVVRLAEDVVLNRYWDDRPEPRPESYKEDVELARESQRDPKQLFRDLRAACESGWDFSSRWFEDEQSLGTIETTNIIPVDLNCLLHHLESTIALSYKEVGNTDLQEKFDAKAANRKAAILKYCWDEKNAFFTDYHWNKKRTMGRVNMAGMFPLFFGLVSKEKANICINKMEMELLKPGGLTTTTVASGQQWDAPNGWAPLQWIGYKALVNYNREELATSLAEDWLALNEKVYKNTGKMVEKYNVYDMSLEAGGGEYPVQDGFGWTNGVALSLMQQIEQN